MDLELSEQHQDLLARVREVVARAIAPHARDLDRQGRFPLEAQQALAAGGFLGMLVPKALGGSGAGSVGYALAMTEVSRACASSAVTMAVTNMVADAIAAWGSDEQKRDYIPRIASGELVAGSFALSEPAAGSDAASLQATATKKGDHYVLNGSKCWITSGDRAGVILVMAKTDTAARASGISAFLVDPKTPGFAVGRHEEKMGLRGSSTVTFSMDDVVVPEHARLGAEGVGFKIAMRALDGGRIGIGSQSIGLGYAALDVALQHARTLGETVSQSVQWKLSDIATELDAARLLVLRAATLKDAGVPFAREAAMAKVFGTEAANRATHRALEILGPKAATDDCAAERLFRDVRVTTIYEGTSEIQRIVIARSVLASP